jgi:ribosomal protein S20
MANHVSALKRARQTVTRTEVNRANRSRVRTSLRALREALAKGDVKAARTQYRETVSTLDKRRLWRWPRHNAARSQKGLETGSENESSREQPRLFLSHIKDSRNFPGTFPV